MKLKIDTKDFRVKEGAAVKLKNFPTECAPYYDSKEHYEEILQDHVKCLDHYQSLLYAHNHYALLLLFQGMDTSGKDGAIKHVLTGTNPAGCQVYSFKQPSSEELEHDFLWRATRALPERGRIGIFNRSYYEEVLIVRVHPELLKTENLPDELTDTKKIWSRRFDSIREYEEHLTENGTLPIKFFLHLSKKEQAKRLLARIDDPDKNWKVNMGDLHERKYWKEYQRAYEEALSETSTDDAPWYIVPADDKRNARIIISHILLEHLRCIKMTFPRATPEHRQELAQMRKLLKKRQK